MKHLLSLAVILCFFSASIAQTPQSVPYQAVARDASGNLLVNQQICVQFTVKQGAGNIVVYQEYQGATTNKLGLFTMNLNSGASHVEQGSFSSINWSSGGAEQLQVDLDISGPCTGSNTFTTMGTSPMQSVPYAIDAGYASSAASSVTSPISGNGTSASPIGCATCLTTSSGASNPLSAGTGIGVSGSTVSNTGVTSIVAGTNVTISSTGTGGTGAVTVNSSVPAGSVTADNGLNVNTGNNVELGGTLTKTTTITGGNFTLTDNLTGTGDLNVENSGSAALYVLGHHGNTTDGFVGINNTSPAARLDINGSQMINGGLNNTSSRPAISAGTLANGELRAYSGGGISADDGFLRISAGGGTSAGVKSYIDLTGYENTSVGPTDMLENITLGTSGTPRVRISNTGNVGIGITTPNSTLHVAGSLGALTDWGILVVADNNVNGSNGLSFGYDNTNNWGWMYARTTGNTGRTININNDVYATWNAGTGIGTATPKSELDVKGGVTVGSYAGTNAAPTNGMIVSGNVGIGNNAPNGQAILDLSNSSNYALVLPQIATTSAPSTPTKGMTFYNSTTNCLEYWNGSAWVNVLVGGNLAWTTDPATVCTGQNVSYAFTSTNGASYQVTLTGTGNTVNGTNATVTPLTVTATGATTTLTVNTATSGTLTVTLNGCPNATQITQTITSGYGNNVMDVNSSNVGSLVTTAANEIIFIDYETYNSSTINSPPTVNGSTSGVTNYWTSGTGCNSSQQHYDWYYLAANAGTYTLGDAGNLSHNWAIGNVAVKNTYGCPLSASNIHYGPTTGGNNAGWDVTNCGNWVNITTNSVLPVGAFLCAATGDDGSSCGSGEANCSPQTGFAIYQAECDGDGNNETIGGVTITSAATQTLEISNTSQKNAGWQMILWWVHTRNRTYDYFLTSPIDK